MNSFYYLIFSLIIDFVWTLFWSGKWSHISHDFERSIHIIVIFTSWIGILLKIFVLSSIALVEWSNIKSSLPTKLQEKLTNNSGFVAQQDEV